jgi:hypothetical protein
MVGLLLLAACSTQSPPEDGTTTAPASPGSAAAPAGTTAPARSAAPPNATPAKAINRTVAQTDPNGRAASSTSFAIPNGTTTVSQESRENQDDITVAASRLNGIWVLHLPRQVEVWDAGDFQVRKVGEYIDVFCGVHHQGQQLGMACPMMWRLNQSARAEGDGDQVRFEWQRANLPTIIIEGRFTSPTEITAEEIVDMHGTGVPHPVAPARMQKIMNAAAASPSSTKAEGILRGAIDDMQRGTVTASRYAAEVADQLRTMPPLTAQDLVSLGPIEDIRYLGATAVVTAGWFRNVATKRSAPEAPDHLSDKPVYVFDVQFDRDSRLCRVDLSPEGLAARLDCR